MVTLRRKIYKLYPQPQADREKNQMNANQLKSIFGKIIADGNALVIFVFVLANIASIGVAEIYAQKGKPAKIVSKKKPPSSNKIKYAPFPANPCVPPESDNLSIVEIDKDSKLSLTARTKGESKILADSKSLSSLPEVLSLADKKSIVTIKVDPRLDFGSAAKILYDIRHRVKSCVKVEVSDENFDQFAYLPPEPTPENEVVRPNPLTLIVELKKDNKITLNNDDEGSLNDTSTITEKLEKIFKDREEAGVFREDSNEVEKTVFVKAAPTAKFGDVLKIVAALKKAGASPVGLQIDDSEDLPKPIAPKF